MVSETCVMARWIQGRKKDGKRKEERERKKKKKKREKKKGKKTNTPKESRTGEKKKSKYQESQDENKKKKKKKCGRTKRREKEKEGKTEIKRSEKVKRRKKTQDCCWKSYTIKYTRPGRQRWMRTGSAQAKPECRRSRRRVPKIMVLNTHLVEVSNWVPKLMVLIR